MIGEGMTLVVGWPVAVLIGVFAVSLVASRWGGVERTGLGYDTDERRSD